MVLSIEETAALRDQLHTLDPDHNLQHRAFYAKMRIFYITNSEGSCPKSYDDGKGYITVGVGFNMDRVEARAEWDRAFGGTISFDAVYRGERELTEDEIAALLHDGLMLREAQLQEIYAGIWPFLRPNERLAIESAYYNASSLVNEATRFCGHIKRYVFEKDMGALQQAFIELKERSNREPPNIKEGIQRRRDSEAEMLATFVIPASALVISKPLLSSPPPLSSPRRRGSRKC